MSRPLPEAAPPPSQGAPPINLANVVPLTEVEGPGPRFAVWTQGCRIGCADCCNPHLWSHEPRRQVSADQLLAELDQARAKHPQLEGVTLIGGEPFEQDQALAPFAEAVRARGLTVMAFTGHLLEELEARESPLLPHCDLLVDGPYQVENYTTQRRFIGSTNQRLFFLSAAYAPNDPRFHEPNTAEIRMGTSGEVQVVGFPFPAVREQFGPGSALAKAQRREGSG